LPDTAATDENERGRKTDAEQQEDGRREFRLRTEAALRWEPAAAMITGAHTIIFTKEAEAVRTLFRDVLGFPAVDAGGGWLIFALPPAELAAHPADEADRYELYLMCDDVRATVAELEGKGVEFSRPISEEDFGLLTAIKLPGGGELGLYEPRHSVPQQAG
jgi:hypothetical protein